MLERIAMQPGRVCSAPECAGAERKLRACRDDMLVELALMHDAEILSFPASPEEAGLGVLALGVETWLREATLYGQETEEHARHLLAHGLAHLLGHDHGPAMDECCAFLLEKSAEASSCTA